MQLVFKKNNLSAFGTVYQAPICPAYEPVVLEVTVHIPWLVASYDPHNGNR